MSCLVSLEQSATGMTDSQGGGSALIGSFRSASGDSTRQRLPVLSNPLAPLDLSDTAARERKTTEQRWTVKGLKYWSRESQLAAATCNQHSLGISAVQQKETMLPSWLVLACQLAVVSPAGRQMVKGQSSSAIILLKHNTHIQCQPVSLQHVTFMLALVSVTTLANQLASDRTAPVCSAVPLQGT